MSDLREKIAEIVREASQTKNRQFAYVEFSDAILSLPELREALEALSAWRDVQNLGTGFMKDGKRIDPADVYLPPSD